MRPCPSARSPARRSCARRSRSPTARVWARSRCDAWAGSSASRRCRSTATSRPSRRCSKGSSSWSSTRRPWTPPPASRGRCCATGRTRSARRRGAIRRSCSLFATEPLATPAWGGAVEALLAVLRDAGASDEAAVHAYRLVTTFATGYVLWELRQREQPALDDYLRQLDPVTLPGHPRPGGRAARRRSRGRVRPRPRPPPRRGPVRLRSAGCAASPPSSSPRGADLSRARAQGRHVDPLRLPRAERLTRGHPPSAAPTFSTT